jgi:hypothetical protein
VQEPLDCAPDVVVWIGSRHFVQFVDYVLRHCSVGVLDLLTEKREHRPHGLLAAL